MRVLEQKESRIVKLVRRFQAGDTSAYAELYELAYPQLYYFVYRMLRDRHEAQDVTQEIFVSIFQSLKKLENPQTFRRWANRMALNACIDHVRAKQAQETESIDTLFPAGAGVKEVREPGTEAVILSAERSACVMRALDELSPQLRATVLMRFYFGYKEREIAEEMQVPLNTVKRRMMLAKKRLSGSLSGVYSFVPFFCLRKAVRGEYRLEYRLLQPFKGNEVEEVFAGGTENAPPAGSVPTEESTLSAGSAPTEEGTPPAGSVPAAGQTGKKPGPSAAGFPRALASVYAAGAAAAVIAVSVCTGQPETYVPSQDTEPPYITGYRETEKGMEVFLHDDRSGISWQQVRVTGNRIIPVQAAQDGPIPGETSQDGIIIPLEDFPVTMEAWDTAGNYRIYRISLVPGGPLAEGI